MYRDKGCLIVLALALRASALNAPELYATVKINFVDSFGRPVPFKVEKFQACCLEGNKDYNQYFHGAMADGIPKIEFKYRLKPVNTRDFAVTEGKVEIVNQKAFLTIAALPNRAARIADISGMVVSGVFLGAKPSDQAPTWVRLLSPYGSGVVRDAEVDATGHFALREIREPGNYVVLVCRGSEVLASQTVQVTFERREIKIQISK
jgi:hypothetical protein